MTLGDKISAHLSILKPSADLLPGVVIVHNLEDKSILWMSAKGLKELNITIADLAKLSGPDYHAKYFNPDDAKDYVPKLWGLLQRNNNDECVSFFQQVKINGQKEWTWHLSTSKVFLRDDKSMPILMITQSIAIEPIKSWSLKAERTLKENIFLKRNMGAFSKLSKREIEVLTCLASGESAIICGEKLFISPKTVETHRKNIRKKLGIESFAELSNYARAFDLI